MREIKFRGLNKKNEWVFGVYFNLGYSETIVDSFYNEIENKHNFTYHDIIPETVGQFTGLQDKNGKDIYEGDILIYDNGTKANVIFKEGAFMGYDGFASCSDDAYLKISLDYNPIELEEFTVEVIGNIHE